MAKTATASATDIIETWRADGIRYVRFELPDMHGTSRSKIVPIEQASGYCEEGLNMYGGAAVLDSRSDVVPGTLYHEEIGYGDQRLIPDPETAAVVPWAEATARFICDSQFGSAGAAARARRATSSGRQLERCHDLGYEPVLGFEPEFYLLTPGREPLFTGYQIFNTVRNTYVPMITELVDHMNAFGIEIITANCEYAGSQWEINFRPGAGLAGPDNAFSFKNAVKEIAHSHGLIRDLHVEAVRRLGRLRLPRPREPDSARSRRERVRRRLRPARASPTSAGSSSPASCATPAAIYTLLAPTVNCLKRRRTHTFSPTNISWGPEDRTALVRIKGGSSASRHVENRAPTGALRTRISSAPRCSRAGPDRDRGGARARAAGREPPAEEDPSKAPLPTSVREGLDALEADPKLVDALGQEFVTAYTTMRRYELQRFDDHVTDWERQEYVEVF